jgi:hypothetical protein
VGKIIGFDQDLGIESNCPPTAIAYKLTEIVGWAKLLDLTSISASNQIAHQPRSVRYGDFHFLVGHEGLLLP